MTAVFAVGADENQSVVIGSSGFVAAINAVYHNRARPIFLMTDGVGDPLGRGDGPVGRFLATEWAEPPDMLSFAGQVAFARRSYDDDRTVVGVRAPR